MKLVYQFAVAATRMLFYFLGKNLMVEPVDARIILLCCFPEMDFSLHHVFVLSCLLTNKNSKKLWYLKTLCIAKCPRVRIAGLAQSGYLAEVHVIMEQFF
jgi:hypothetical protein